MSNGDLKAATTSLAYDTMLSDYWEQIDALRGTTASLRAEGRTYLPQHAKEEDISWIYRRDRSFLTPYYDDAIVKLSTKPFSKPVNLGEELPEKLAPMMSNMDLCGRNLTVFAREVFDAGCNYGVTHMLVDFAATGGGQSAGEEQALELRPAVVHYKPTDVIAWKTRRTSNGQTVLTEVRLKETGVEEDGDWGEKTVERVRVYRENNYEVWRKGDDGVWAQEGGDKHSFGAVPLVSFYTNRTGFMTAKPPLWGLADLNIEHWQRNSDFGHCLHVNMAPFWVTSQKLEEVKSLTIGSGRLLCLGDPAHWLKTAEHTGQALGAGREELDRLEARMRYLAMEPYVENSGTPTATGRAIDESKSQSAVQMWIRALEGALEDAFAMAAKWVKLELPETFSVDVFSEFTAVFGKSEDMQILSAARRAGDLDNETFLQEMKRRGMLAEAVTVEEILERLEQEGPDLSSLIPPQFKKDEDEEGDDEEDEDEEDAEPDEEEDEE